MRSRELLVMFLAWAVAACAGDVPGDPATSSPAPYGSSSPGATAPPGCEQPCGSASCTAPAPLALLPPNPSADPADDVVDPLTGHRVVRLSRLENGGSGFYFTQAEFNCRGDKLVIASERPDAGRWLYTVDLETLVTEPLAPVPAIAMEVVSPVRNEVLYIGEDDTLMATDLDTRETRTLARLPDGANGITVNADGTLAAGYVNEGLAEYQERHPDNWVHWFVEYHAAHLRSAVYTVDLATGAVRTIHEEDNWIDHTQFSPADPRLLLFTHEGPPELVAERTWAVDAIAGGDVRPLYPERTAREVVNHEFFSADGARVYFDHQVPLGGTYSIGAVDVATGAVVDLPIAAEDWGLHYNVSSDGLTFASDGNGDGRKTALLYRLVDGALVVEPLADLSAFDYDFQPSVHFTRDDRWVVYQASRDGRVDVYAAEVAPARSVP